MSAFTAGDRVTGNGPAVSFTGTVTADTEPGDTHVHVEWDVGDRDARPLATSRSRVELLRVVETAAQRGLD